MTGTHLVVALTRFATFCCAADAVPYSVTVDSEGTDFPDDTWLTVTGTLMNESGEFGCRRIGSWKPRNRTTLTSEVDEELGKENAERPLIPAHA